LRHTGRAIDRDTVLRKHRGLTWRGLLLEGEKKVREDTSE
jgi:hypothetical protein